MRIRRGPGALTLLIVAAATNVTLCGYATLGSTWQPGAIAMSLQLPPGTGLADGSASFNESAQSALTYWNRFLGRSQFTGIVGPADRGTDGDLINQVFFDSTYYGSSFGRDTLAITTRWTLNKTQRIEADVVFNDAIRWDSYRGNVRSDGVWDLRRVALHEFGHVLGLDHPDEHDQRVTALMNSRLGDLDMLTADDVAGAQSLYGRHAVPRVQQLIGLGY